MYLRCVFNTEFKIHDQSQGQRLNTPGLCVLRASGQTRGPRAPVCARWQRPCGRPCAADAPGGGQ